MGDIADAILEGVLCQVCGGLHDDFQLPDDWPKDKEPPVVEPAGFPQTCSDCRDTTAQGE
jgi:hypothetical protein